jgi:hypothetical protein
VVTVLDEADGGETKESDLLEGDVRKLKLKLMDDEISDDEKRDEDGNKKK